MAGQTSTQVKRRYNESNYVRVHLQIRPDVKDMWVQAAKAANQSLSSFIADSVAQRIANDQQK